MKSLIKIALLFFVISFSSCKVETYTGSWAEKTVVAESNDDNVFKNPLRFYNQETHLQYTILNDNKNIYIYIKATEQLVQLKIIKSGILIKLDTNGNTKYQSSMLYPIQDKANKASIAPPKDWDTFVSRFPYDHAYMGINGFKTITDEEYPILNNKNISVKMSWDSIGVLRYKAIIPFVEFYKDSLSSNDINKNIGISILLKQLTQPTDPKNAPVSTANSNYSEHLQQRGNAKSGYNVEPQMNETQAYLYNIKSMRFNYTLTLKN